MPGRPERTQNFAAAAYGVLCGPFADGEIFAREAPDRSRSKWLEHAPSVEKEPPASGWMPLVQQAVLSSKAQSNGSGRRAASPTGLIRGES